MTLFGVRLLGTGNSIPQRPEWKETGKEELRTCQCSWQKSFVIMSGEVGKI